MKLSIITPVYNGEKTIRRTIESVIRQNTLDYEYIIVDGGSNDNTINIIKEYKEKLHEHLKIISEIDNGIYDAMNKGIKLSTGDIVGIINSDDWYEDNIFERVIDEISNYDEAIAYGFMRTVKNSCEYQISINNAAFLNERMINHPACFVTRTVYEKYGLYNINYKIAADYEFMLRVYMQNSRIFIPLYFLIANFSLGGVSQSYNGWMEQIDIKKKYGLISRKKYFFESLKNLIRKVL